MTLKTALAAGMTIAVDGEDLVLAAEAPPSADMLHALTCHKPEIVRLLRHKGAGPSGIRRQSPATCGGPAEWVSGFAALAAAEPPDGFTQQQWRQLLEDAESFLDGWASEAIRQGWSVLDAFGVHVRAPAARYDGMGLVPLIGGGKIVALTADRATIRMPSGSELTVLKRPLQDAVPIWTLARPTGEPDGELQPISGRSASPQGTAGAFPDE